MKARQRFALSVKPTPKRALRRGALGALLFCLGLGLLPSCSDNPDGDDEDEELDPVVACNTYASTWCNRSLNCYAQVGRVSQEEADGALSDCVSVIVDRLPCSAASSVEDDYDKCISQIKGMPCSRWDVPRLDFNSVRPPTSCQTALSYE